MTISQLTQYRGRNFRLLAQYRQITVTWSTSVTGDGNDDPFSGFLSGKSYTDHKCVTQHCSVFCRICQFLPIRRQMNHRTNTAILAIRRYSNIAKTRKRLDGVCIAIFPNDFVSSISPLSRGLRTSICRTLSMLNLVGFRLCACRLQLF